MDNSQFRFSTEKALNELAIELNLRERIPHWDAMAGYSYTPGNPEDVQQYLDYYFQLDDEDKKFTLVEMILDAMASQPTEDKFLTYWPEVEKILIKDFTIHEITIYYWNSMINQFERSDIMTPLIKKIIGQMESNT